MWIVLRIRRKRGRKHRGDERDWMGTNIIKYMRGGKFVRGIYHVKMYSIGTAYDSRICVNFQ